MEATTDQNDIGLMTTDVNTYTSDGEGSEGSDISSSDKIVQTICITTGTLGVLGNSFVLVVILSFTRMRKKVANYFIINQSLVDLLAAMLTIATYATKSMSLSKSLSPYQQDVLCRLWLSTFPLWFALTSSTYNLVVLTLERYFKLVHPVTHNNVFTSRKALFAIGCVWLIGPLYHASTLVPTTRMVDNQCVVGAIWPTRVMQKLYGFSTVILLYILPITLQAYCYLRIWLALRERSRAQQNGASTAQNQFSRAQGNVLKTLIIVSICYVICWSSNQIIYLLFNMGLTSVDFSGPFYHFSVVLVFANSCINPFIYIYKYEEFQKGMRQLFCKKKNQILPDIPITISRIA